MSERPAAENDIERIYQRDLAGLNPEGRDCEACGRHMREHEWADLDVNGFALACVFSPGIPSIHICPECGEPITRESGEPYWVEPETKQRHHDPCPIPPGGPNAENGLVEELLPVVLSASPGTPTLTCRKIAEAVAAHMSIRDQPREKNMP